MEMNLKTIKPLKYNSLSELLENFIKHDFAVPENLIDKEIHNQISLTLQELTHEILFQKNWAFLDNENRLHYWVSNDCKKEDFLHTIMRQLLDLNKSNFSIDEDIRFEQISLLAYESCKLTNVCGIN